MPVMEFQWKTIAAGFSSYPLVWPPAMTEVAAELQRRLENLGHVTAVRDYLGALPFRLGY